MFISVIGEYGNSGISGILYVPSDFCSKDLIV